MDEPKVEEVLRHIYDMYENQDVSAKDKTSAWLSEFQKSVSLKICQHAKYFFHQFLFFRFSHGKLPISFFSRKTACTHATLLHKQCVAKFSIRFMSFPNRLMDRCEIQFLLTSSPSRLTQIQLLQNSCVWRFPIWYCWWHLGKSPSTAYWRNFRQVLTPFSLCFLR